MESNTIRPSLSEVNASVDTNKKSVGKKLLAFLGPAYLVSVGYMDPGNWATDLAGGSRYGYTLIWVLLMSNLIALLLQSLCARLGIVRSRDLAQASREMYPKPVNYFLWFLAEIAIAATDLAEVLGMAIGLQLLFDIPLMWGVTITVLDTFIVLLLLNRGMRAMEAFIITMVAIIGLCFLAQMFFSKPDIAEVAGGLIPSIPDSTALYIAIGIIGATVMPHNLYLHSSLVQTRKFERTSTEIKKAIRFNIIDSAIALNMAFLVNSAILILAAATFYKNGLFEVAEIQDAHKLLEPLLGTQWAPVLFAVALIAAGQSSTVTGTLAGQIVMEGYLNIRLAPWLRRLITRLIAIIPAYISISVFGEGSTGDLLVLSQVILSLQLGFAIIPLIHFVSDKKAMGQFAAGMWIKILAWISALVIIGLNVQLVIETFGEWMTGEYAFVLQLTVLPLAVITLGVLLYISIMPLFKGMKKEESRVPHGLYDEFQLSSPVPYKKIAVTLDFSEHDHLAINHALKQGGKEAEYLLIHITESPTAFMFGKETRDYESESDKINMQKYIDSLTALGYKCTKVIGFGKPRNQIPKLVKDFDADLLVMGAHGHQTMKDILFGSTVNAVRHKVKIPVLIVR